jgi:signal transduction histidine kinase
MAQGAWQISTLVDELLLLSQVRKQDVDLVPLQMDEIVANVQERLAFMVEQHQATLIVPDSWPAALGHPSWVEEVWVNYVSNAVKYGGRPEQGISPRIELGYGTAEPDGSGQMRPATPFTHDVTVPAAGSGDHSFVRFWVRDNGGGLTPSEQERLFTPFTRLRQVGTKGHGLGLSVVRRIVEKLGGEVSLASAVGKGSVFSFTLRSGEAIPR